MESYSKSELNLGFIFALVKKVHILISMYYPHIRIYIFYRINTDENSSWTDAILGVS